MWASAPKKRASTISRASPSTRDNSVIPLTIAVFFSNLLVIYTDINYLSSLPVSAGSPRDTAVLQIKGEYYAIFTHKLLFYRCAYEPCRCCRLSASAEHSRVKY